MKKNAAIIEEYLQDLQQGEKDLLLNMRKVLKDNLPSGFEETMSYSMPSFVLPLSLYPSGYHTRKGQPVPFISYAIQKDHLALYHSGIYADPNLRNWYVDKYTRTTGKKPDMGKSCLRFRKSDQIPWDLLAQLARKMTPSEWIEIYEASISGRIMK